MLRIAFRIGRHQQDRIIDPEGICPALTAGSHLNAGWMNLILDIDNESERDDRGLLVQGAVHTPMGGGSIATPARSSSGERCPDCQGL